MRGVRIPYRTYLEAGAQSMFGDETAAANQRASFVTLQKVVAQCWTCIKAIVSGNRANQALFLEPAFLDFMIDDSATSAG